VTARRALFLSGKFGAGHDTLAEACAAALEPQGVESHIVDCMPMLGGGGATLGNWVFKSLLSVTPVYDGFHFSQLRGNGAVGRFMDRAAVKVMFPKLVAEVDRDAPDLIVSVFATGASAAARLKADRPSLTTVVFMTDSFAHGMWAHDGTDLFLVTSELAAASVRRYCPDATVRVVDAPVRPAFYEAPDQGEARAALGVPEGAHCILLMSGAWGIGPLDEVARALAREGFWVLAVCGTNERLATKLRAVSLAHPTVIAFGYTDRIADLMAASDVIVTSSGDTCREARVVGRPLVLLDVVPGHGRENLMHELELGDASVCLATPESVVGNVRRALDRAPSTHRAGATVGTWSHDFVDALREAGVELAPRAD
jgi:UDP-N-acetylglucosamine:LPS N-acetylglucosamine transferase